MVHRHRGNRMAQNKLKADRKQGIARHVYGFEWYPHHGQYDKGKVHCSCPMCASKTSGALNKSRGPLDSHRSFCRLSTTNGRYGKKNYRPSDMRKVDALRVSLAEAGL